MSAVRTIGKISALTAISKIKDGNAADLRATLQRLIESGGGAISGLGTIHRHRQLDGLLLPVWWSAGMKGA
jgi:hypothetical protein